MGKMSHTELFFTEKIILTVDSIGLVLEELRTNSDDNTLFLMRARKSMLMLDLVIYLRALKSQNVTNVFLDNAVDLTLDTVESILETDYPLVLRDNLVIKTSEFLYEHLYEKIKVLREDNNSVFPLDILLTLDS